MLPTALTLRNYRCYPGPQRFELRPLTLIYGTNSAGKSALLRSLPLLADSCRHNGLDAIDGNQRLRKLELDFDSLRWRGLSDDDDRTIGLSMHWDGDPQCSTVAWNIAESKSWHRLLVERLRVLRESDGAAECVLDLEWKQTRDERRSATLSYRRPTLDDDVVIPIEFRGLIPRWTPEQTNAPADVPSVLAERLRHFADSVLWLQSLRPAPSRYTRRSTGVHWSLEPDGADAPRVLSGEPEVRERVSSWYQQHVGVTLAIDDVTSGRDIRIKVRGHASATHDFDLIDTGEGLSQVLPVLTAVEMAREHRQRSGPAIIAIEEPEAHLHTDLQKALAERICQVVAESRPRVVLETHSELFLLAIQLQIIRGVVPPEDVAVYWVRQDDHGAARAECMQLDPMGRLPRDWPPDAFRDALALAADIQDERAAGEAL